MPVVLRRCIHSAAIYVAFSVTPLDVFENSQWSATMRDGLKNVALLAFSDGYHTVSSFDDPMV